MKYLLLILATLGIMVSSLALREHYREYGDSPCSINEHWDCGVVNHSPYAVMAGNSGRRLRHRRVHSDGRARIPALVPPAARSHFRRARVLALPCQHRSPRSRSVVYLLRHLSGDHLADVTPHPRSGGSAVRPQACLKQSPVKSGGRCNINRGRIPKPEGAIPCLVSTRDLPPTIVQPRIAQFAIG